MGTVNQATESETADSAWKGLYRVGGAAALLDSLLGNSNRRIVKRSRADVRVACVSQVVSDR